MDFLQGSVVVTGDLHCLWARLNWASSAMAPPAVVSTGHQWYIHTSLILLIGLCVTCHKQMLKINLPYSILTIHDMISIAFLLCYIVIRAAHRLEGQNSF